MKRSSLRGFGMACILIGSLYAGLEYFGLTDATSENVQKYEEKIAKLEAQLKDAKEQIKELEKQQTANETQESVAKNPSAEESSSNGQEEVTEGILYIYSGLTPYEIAKKLKDMGIIKNSTEMELFLAQPEYARSIQKGQYRVNSAMSVEEIANLITGKSSS